MKKKFVIVQWPESQDLMEQPWFHECHLINDENGLKKYGSAAYFVPEDRFYSISCQDELKSIFTNLNVEAEKTLNPMERTRPMSQVGPYLKDFNAD